MRSELRKLRGGTFLKSKLIFRLVDLKLFSSREGLENGAEGLGAFAIFHIPP